MYDNVQLPSRRRGGGRGPAVGRPTASSTSTTSTPCPVRGSAAWWPPCRRREWLRPVPHSPPRRAAERVDDKTGKVVSVKRPKRWGRMFELRATTVGGTVNVSFP